MDGSTPGARVTWSTTVPPECVASVTVEFRNGSNDSVVRSYSNTSTSETEIIETGLQCATVYTIRVGVTGVPLLDHRSLASNQVDVTVGGEVNTCVASSSTIELRACINLSLVVLCHFTAIPAPVGVIAEVTADNTSIRVLWEWSRQGVLMCLESVRVDYQSEGGSLMMYTLDNATATGATLSNLQCNTQYYISVYAEGGMTGNRSVPGVVSLPARGIVAVILST